MPDGSARNPHGDFKAIGAARPRFEHVAVDPHAPGRAAALNYKLLISGVVPRPIAFVNTRSGDGATTNLAPFSYFNLINYDPPLFVVGIASPAAADAGAKDTLRNLVASREAVLNIISESFVEAANATSIDAPYGCSEWPLSCLTPLYDCHTVRCPRVAEAVFSIEVKLDMVKEYDSRTRPGSKSGTLVVLEGTRFWVRGDAINDDRSLVDPAALRPISRLGGITYARSTEAFELTRPKFDDGPQGGKQALEKLNKTQPS